MYTVHTTVNTVHITVYTVHTTVFCAQCSHQWAEHRNVLSLLPQVGKMSEVQIVHTHPSVFMTHVCVYMYNVYGTSHICLVCV